MNNDFKRVKLGCYMNNISMAVVGNLPPLLFVTFNTLYGINYALLGSLVLINFVTQLLIDLIFSFFSHKFNIPKTVKFTPILTIVGLSVYALLPFAFPNHIYLTLVIGTVIFSASSGLSEVLISPVIAAIPSENPDHEMSKLHSIYAWGVVLVIFISTLYLLFIGKEYWQWIVLFFTIIPFVAATLFFRQKLPELETPEKVSGVLSSLKNKTLWLCVGAIFLGGAMECTMAQWSSSYLEQALRIPKIWGDIFGVAMFGLMLGLGRTAYAKYGNKIEKILLLGAIGATICYFTAAISNVGIISLLACALTGFCTSMLWPGSLIVSAERIPHGGVFLYAMMAAGGDLGASVSPQLVGIIADAIKESPKAVSFATNLGLTTEQLGLKCGILIGMLFSLIGIFVFLHIFRTRKKEALPLEK